MKKIIAITLIFTAGIFSTKAQTTLAALKKMPAEQKAHLIADSFRTILNLNNEQYAKVYAELLNGVKKAMPIMQSDDGRMSKGKKMKAILLEQEEKLKPVLSAEQFALYQTKKKNLIAYYRSHWSEEKLIFNAPES